MNWIAPSVRTAALISCLVLALAAGSGCGRYGPPIRPPAPEPPAEPASATPAAAPSPVPTPAEAGEFDQGEEPASP